MQCIVQPVAFLIINYSLMASGKQLGPGDSIDTTKVPGKVGVTLELCAGIIDKVRRLSAVIFHHRIRFDIFFRS